MSIKVVIIGPESTGKSTLAAQLAAHFGCQWVPEFARTYLEEINREYAYPDLLAIAKGQVKMEDDYASKQQKLLICDTDLHVVQVWSQHKFGKVDPWILREIQNRRYDLYLLTDVDIPWENDPLREHPEPEMRMYFKKRYMDLIKATGVPYSTISGTMEERLQRAVGVVQSLFASKGN
jgi:NadR type nicotinamide-nucleotide adenylyltransferase